MKKIDKKNKSIVCITFWSTVNSWDIVKSKRMKHEYNPIVKRDKFSVN